MGSPQLKGMPQARERQRARRGKLGAPGMGAMILGLGQLVGRALLGTPVEEGAAKFSWEKGNNPRKEEEKESAERAPSRRDSQASEGTKGCPTEADTPVRSKRLSEQNSFQGGGRRDTGLSWQRTPQRDYTLTGAGVSGQRTPQNYNSQRGTGVSGHRTPQNYNSQRETGVSGHRTPQGGCKARGTGVSSQLTPQRDCRPRETGVSGQRTPQGATSQRRLQQDYVLRETGVSGQRAPNSTHQGRATSPPCRGAPSRAAP
ncbi:Hypothetical predicted protein [Mytilus galloprovincialis]|uniref:Uncharacterized protein n=1 Tax=Mytilus galloprovincialis TaxID=29158 RepID=A0A8B6EQI5_MYTGA|nr:Hypothetical predicted protein [Mytilus galloprovincialis]